ncbi:MAG: hypothetical protein QM725_09840 [Lacibacter sp.]
MKKLILTAIMMIAIGGALSAQTKKGNGSAGTNPNNPGYVDANKNNVCDNFENRTFQNNNRQMRRGGGNCMNRSNAVNRRGGAGRRSW